MESGSKNSAIAALQMSMTSDIANEKSLAAHFRSTGAEVAAVNFGGEFITSINKIIERAIVAAKKEGVISEAHSEQGAVAGAAHEAISQIMNKAIGLNVGGKIAIARYGEHISVAIFFGIGLLHLNEISIGLGHRVV